MKNILKPCHMLILRILETEALTAREIFEQMMTYSQDMEVLSEPSVYTYLRRLKKKGHVRIGNDTKLDEDTNKLKITYQITDFGREVHNASKTKLLIIFGAEKLNLSDLSVSLVNLK